MKYCKSTRSEIRSIDTDDLQIGEDVYLRRKDGIDKYVVCYDSSAVDNGLSVLVFDGETHLCAILQYEN